MAMDVGAVTVLLWGFREREKIQDIWDLLTGVRFTTSFTRIGGLAQDISPETLAAVKNFLDAFPRSLDECEKLLIKNRIFIERCEGVGRISAAKAIDIGMTGPALRACGIGHDLRRDEPYLVYDKLDFHVPVYTDGDTLARFYVRMQEMRESVKILYQVLDQMPQGPVNASDPKKVLPKKERTYGSMEELIHDFMIVNFGIHPPVGEIYNAIEGSKGELGFYLVSNGEGNPWRLKIRSPSFVNLQALPVMLKGGMISDVVAVIGSLDPVMGEADK
jgi:NADH-quinone oxidoreductase subunit D